jgi:uncharacterized Zn finger protein
VNIKVKTLASEAWNKLAEVLTTRAIFSAKLLAGEMPENIEEAFRDAGLSLFPDKGGDLDTDCSCPDWSNPCKHIAAVYYLLGEEFDRDPFLIFKLRGMGREELIGLLGSQPESSFLAEPEAQPAREPLPEDPETFWGTSGPECDPGEEVYVPSVAAALPKRLGNFPFWRGQEGFLTAMEKIYRQASSVGLNVFLGEYRTAKEDRRGSGTGEV